jgi:hypothetical protein
MILKILAAAIVVNLFISCRNNAHEIFFGTWKKDSSTSGPTTRLSKPYESGTLVLKKNADFNYKWRADDVMGDYDGEFEINDSTNGLKILCLMHGQKLYRKYIILEADDKRMKTSLKSSYTLYNSDSTIFFEMVDVFKKIETVK